MNPMQAPIYQLGIVSKAVIKYLYDADKFLSKVMTMSSSFMGISKQVR